LSGLQGFEVNLKYAFDIEGPGVILCGAALETMLKYRQLCATDKEAGGQLFARFEGRDTFITDATPPKPLDIRKRIGFKPNQWIQRLDIKAKYLLGKHFVGDWHTHPEPIPSPSQVDLTSASECFKQSRHQLKAFVMIIVGTESPPNGLSVYLVDNSGIKRLSCVSQ
jgi:integrative and conjugative element protein (TIGR02256 family)